MKVIIKEFQYTEKIRESIIKKELAFLIDEFIDEYENNKDYFKEHIVRIFHSHGDEWKIIDIRICENGEGDKWIQPVLITSADIQDEYFTIENVVPERRISHYGHHLKTNKYITPFEAKTLFVSLEKINTTEDVLSIIENK